MFDRGHTRRGAVVESRFFRGVSNVTKRDRVQNKFMYENWSISKKCSGFKLVTLISTYRSCVKIEKNISQTKVIYTSIY